ncbi:MAG: hypothetical protein K8U03_21560 [Planctomycetia bacterium]|nr:hypothetical protein [Planctomycetia bacterium]
MKRMLIGIAPAIVMLVHAMAPPAAQASWFRRCHTYYSPRYSCGYSNYYRPTYYGYSNNGYSNYGYANGYGNYGAQYGGMPYGVPGGFGGNSALTTILAMNGGLGGANTSMYMTVPMSNGYGPASLLQVPLGGAAGRPTFLQVPMGGGPGQPIYLQMEIGGGAGSAPVAPTPRSVGSTSTPSSGSLVVDEESSERVASNIEATFTAAAMPYVVQTSAPVADRTSAVATTATDGANGSVPEVADSDFDPGRGSSRLFRFAVFEKERKSPAAPTAAPRREVEARLVGPSDELSSEPSLSDSSIPWKVKQ